MISFSFSPESGISYNFPDIPVCDAPDGIKYDFLNGLRILLPKDGKKRHVTFWDEDTHTILFDQLCEPGSMIRSNKTYFISFGVRITEESKESVIWEYTLDLASKSVMILMPVSTIGDTLAWTPYLELFQEKHDCRLFCVMKQKFIDILEKQYPDISFVTPEEANKIDVFAAYKLGLWWGGNTDNQPVDHRLVGLHKTAGYILGVDTQNEYRPRFDLSAPRKIKEPYVCIAAQSTTMCKNWCNPFGWMDVIQFLKESGYRVLCVDRDKVQGAENVYNSIPWGCEDFTGDLPLQERIDLIKDADFFIGLPSGLSWLAWGCKVPVVLISGFSMPHTEFYTPYRVTNYNACTGCWNDVRYDFDHMDWLWCPRHKGTPKQHECSRLISSQQVIDVIKRIPSFRRGNK